MEAEEKPRKTDFFDRAESFASAPLLGRVYRMYASSPDFCGLDPAWAGCFGVSFLVLPDGSGRLLVSKHNPDNTVRHATMPLRLKGEEHEAQGQLAIELKEFVEQCVIHGESAASSGSEARKLVEDFACEILDLSDDGDWGLKLYPCLGGHTFCYGDKEDGELQTTLPSDVMMTTPNCDELGHYLFRPTEARVSSATVDAVVAEEVAAWDAMLISPKLSAGDTVRVRETFQSGNEEAGNLKQGLIGTVKEVDEDGDAEVDFGADMGVHYVLSGDFIKLQIERPHK
jgi:hypothetical protein